MSLTLSLPPTTGPGGMSGALLLPGEAEAREALGLPTEAMLQALLVRGDGRDWLDHRTLVDHSVQYRGGSDPNYGKLNNSACVTFNGSSEWVTFAASPLADATAASVMAWIYLGAHSAAYQEILSTPDTSQNTELRIDTSRHLQLTCGRSGNSTLILTDAGLFPLTDWAFVGFTWSAGAAKLYLNGTEVGSGTATFTQLRWDNAWVFGARYGNTLPFSGRAAGLWAYDRVLSPSEITAAAAGPVNTTGLVFAAPMCEVYGDKLHDVVGGRHGTITGTLADIWANKQLLHHHLLRRGGTTLISTITAGQYRVVPHDYNAAKITYPVPTNTALIADFAGTRGQFEGLDTRIDCTGEDVEAWQSGKSVETGLAFGQVRNFPKWWKDGESRLVKRVRANMPTKLVCYGTSLTAGANWATQINTWVRYRNSVLTTVNSGASGQQSSYGVANLTTQVLAHNPDVVTIEFDMNDSDNQSLTPLTVAESTANYVTMVDAILAAFPNCEIWLMPMNPTTGVSPNGNARHPDLAEYYQAKRDLVVQYGDPRVRLCDQHSRWLQVDSSVRDTLIPDGVHVNQTGTDLYTVPFMQDTFVGHCERLMIFDAAVTGGVFAPEFSDAFA